MLYAFRRHASSYTSSAFSLVNRRSALFASPILPAALMRGAMVNASVWALASSFLVASRYLTAGRGFRLMSLSPSYTMSRFSPVRGTLSATVAIAARSSSAYARSPSRAHAILNATPAPHRLSYG